MKLSLRGNLVTAAIICLFLVLAACNDDDSSGPTNPSVVDGSSDSSEVDSGNESSSSGSSSGSTGSSSSSSKTDSEYSDGATLQCSSSTENVFMGTMTDERDGQTYKTIKIGTQTWMAENLNYAYTGIPYNFDRKDSSDSISWCYNDSAEYCAKYGRLYTWAAAMDSAALLSDNGEGCGFEVECTPTYPVRGICPSGWHVPTYEEFETLFEAVGNRRIAGLVLKSFEGWHENGNGTYDFGFKALPAGSRNHEGRFGNEGDLALFWSSTTLKYSRAEYMCLDWDEEEASYWIGDNYLEWVAKRYKTYGFSVRCVKD